jgi:hypothetical protein
MVIEKKALKWIAVVGAIPEKWVCIAFPQPINPESPPLYKIIRNK